jgi:hypothetical protein
MINFYLNCSIKKYTFYTIKIKAMKKIGLLALLFIIISNDKVIAQHRDNLEYTSAIGVRFYPGAITYKQKIINDNVIEGVAYFWKGTRITGLYEHYYSIIGMDGLHWFVGPGIHMSFYDNQNFSGSYFGLDGILGLDYKLKNAPLNISIDWQPSFDFGGENGSGFNGGFGGLGIRYVIW